MECHSLTGSGGLVRLIICICELYERETRGGGKNFKKYKKGVIGIKIYKKV